MEIKTEEKRFLLELAKQFPDMRSTACEITALSAKLNLPKGTEHFMSDLHGEQEAFTHIRRCASGVIRKKVDLLFSHSMTKLERSELATLIYYPEEKLNDIRQSGKITYEWYLVTVKRLVKICRLVSEKYTLEKVDEQICLNGTAFCSIISELMSLYTDREKRNDYIESIIKTMIRTGAIDGLITSLANTVNALVVDRLHIVGDIFDRGARADIVMDELMSVKNIDIQWGNHDALWIGAAAGSLACIATAVNNSVTYRNPDVIEIGYGISLRPLALFALEIYKSANVSEYMPRDDFQDDIPTRDNLDILARMRKAISVIQFKLEGQLIMRHPEFHMDDRLLLHKMELVRGEIIIDDKTYKLSDTFFPTVAPEDPYKLTEAELDVMNYLKNGFMRSERLQRHVKFLLQKGEMYTVYNGNLLFHGCIPLDENGGMMALDAADGKHGKAMMDYFDQAIRVGYIKKDGDPAREKAKDLCWFLWCGKDSPLCSRKKITTFERLLINDKCAHSEPSNAYYRSWNDEGIVSMLLNEFSIYGEKAHIINGHIPVNKGENPIKANGKLIVIDGGFCRAYHNKTGIAGYTLIYNADGMKISAHQPFSSKENAVKNNEDILSQTAVFEERKNKILIRDTDEGADIRDRIGDLMLLTEAYKNGEIKEGRSRAKRK